jgi:uncharacterized coiled-coil protein SlyX
MNLDFDDWTEQVISRLNAIKTILFDFNARIAKSENKIKELENLFLLKKHNNTAVLEHQNKLIEELQNKCAELSLKINKQQSSLREFEKQRIEPRFKEIEEQLKITSSY